MFGADVDINLYWMRPMPSAANIVHDEMMRAMGRSLGRLQEGVKKYPQKKPESRYGRTMTLWHSLTNSQHGQAIYSVTRVHGGVEGRWGTNVPYAPYVIDKNRQAWMHKGRWWTLQGEAKRMIPLVVKEFDTAATNIADKLGPLWDRDIIIEVEL